MTGKGPPAGLPVLLTVGTVTSARSTVPSDIVTGTLNVVAMPYSAGPGDQAAVRPTAGTASAASVASPASSVSCLRGGWLIGFLIRPRGRSSFVLETISYLKYDIVPKAMSAT